MTDQVLHLVEIVTSEADVPVAEELLLAADYEPSSYSNRETGLGTTYLLADDAAGAAALAAEVTARLPEWSDLAAVASWRVSAASMRAEDWSESWKRHFHTFRASPRLVVKPSWESYTPVASEKVIALDPGMCFGTGYHGTTRACLQFLDELQERHGSVSCLDAGCGSGILAMGASLLGYAPVLAFDYDPQAVATARENLQLGGIEGVDVVEADACSYVPPFPCKVVAVNILAVVLLEQAERIIGWVDSRESPGYLILSGILIEQYAAVRDRFTALGARQMASVTLQEWQSGCFMVKG